MVLTLIALFGLTGSASAQALNTTFEIEGNAIDQAAPGDDWDSLYYYDLNNIPLSTLNPDLDVYSGLIVDFGDNDTTRFGEGTKDIDSISNWAWQALPPNDKVDITNAQAALYSPGAGNLFLYMEADRFSNDGDASMGLWLIQDPNFDYNSDGTFSGEHVQGIPGDTAAIDVTGDLLVLAHYTNGGVVDSIAVFEWVGAGGDSDDSLGSQGNDAFDIVFKDATTAFGQVNQNDTISPWPYIPKSGTSGIFPENSFFEAGLDLGNLLEGNVPCFAKFLFETRESQSLTSALKDFGLGSFSTFPVVTVNSDTVCAGDSVQLCATVQPGTGIAPFTYEWSTGETTPCIWVNAPGTYSVVVFSDNGCPSDTVSGTLTVSPKPDLTCTGDIWTCDEPACASVTVNNLGSLGSVTYLWSPEPVSGQGTAIACYDTSGTVKVVVTSAAGCIDSCEAVITEDVTPPQITCPPDVNFECDNVGAFGEATATDDFDSNPVITFEDDTTSVRCPLRIERLWIATDDCGNADSCTQIIVVDDTIAPVITCPTDRTFECDAVGSFGVATATDNCDPDPDINLIDRDSTATCPDGYVLVLTYEAVDTCGNADTCSQTITVEDTTPPVITCPADATFNCDDVGAFGEATAVDNCDDSPTITFTDDTTSTTCPLRIVRTWYAEDNCGNRDSCDQILIVDDTTPPVITCPTDRTFECDAVGDFGVATATDNCDTDVDIDLVDRDSTATCADGYVLVLTYTATDACGNADTCEQTITVQDTTPPQITCPSDRTFECDNVGGFGTPSASDNCDDNPEITLIDRDSTATCADGYVLVLTYRAEDNCGNADTCDQTITVEDTTPPQITCPTDRNFECDAVGDFGTPSATDNCDTDPAISLIDRDSTATCADGYILVLTYEARDNCGNADTCSQTITVDDTTPPQITCPSDRTFECDAIGDFGTPSATDNCDDDPAIRLADRDSIPGSCPQNYQLVLTYVAADNCGNEDTCEQTITVQDTTPPEITCPADASFECDAVGGFGEATATDNCDTDPDIRFVDDTTSTTCPLRIERLWIAVDDCGNADSCTQILLVDDTTPPQITCPTDRTFECDNVGGFGSPSATDNCDTDVDIDLIDRDSTATCANGYVLVLTYAATDNCGNADTCSQTITVEDTTPPQITCPSDRTFECDAVGGFGDPSATDNCDDNPEITLIDRDSTATCANGYVLVLTYRAEDNCGNADTCDQTITVEDTTPPEITCAADDSVECDGVVVFTPPTATDNCDPDPQIDIVSTDTIPGPGVGEFTHTRTWSATDACGNTSATCDQSIIVLACPDSGCTFTMGGWGSDCPESQAGDPLSTQPGCIRDHYFSTVFPSGVSVGDRTGLNGAPYFAVRWTTAAAVNAFLPAGGTPDKLKMDATNPVKTHAGVLAGQILALKLNVGFSCAGIFQTLGMIDGDFCYGEFEIPSECGGKFAGLTVDSFLVVADKAVSGQTSVLGPFGANLSDVNFTATCLNELFDNCQVLVSLAAISEAPPTTGDANWSGDVTLADVVLLVNILFKGGDGLSGACDANFDCYATAADIVTVVNHVLRGGPLPSAE
jgi:hypothetical protein